MSPYLAGGMLVAFVAWSGFMYFEGSHNEKTACVAADEKHDLAQAAVTVNAENGVIGTIVNQQKTTEGVDNAYQKNISSIDDLYAHAAGLRSTPAPTGNSLPAIPDAASRPDAAACQPQPSKVYKLTRKDCDVTAARLVGLQAWVNGQRKIR